MLYVPRRAVSVSACVCESTLDGVRRSSWCCRSRIIILSFNKYLTWICLAPRWERKRRICRRIAFQTTLMRHLQQNSDRIVCTVFACAFFVPSAIASKSIYCNKMRQIDHIAYLYWLQQLIRDQSKTPYRSFRPMYLDVEANLYRFVCERARSRRIRCTQAVRAHHTCTCDRTRCSTWPDSDRSHCVNTG